MLWGSVVACGGWIGWDGLVRCDYPRSIVGDDGFVDFAEEQISDL